MSNKNKVLLGARNINITDCRKGTHTISDLRVNDFFLHYGDLCILIAQPADKPDIYSVLRRYDIYNFSKSEFEEFNHTERVSPVRIRIEISDYLPDKNADEGEDDK